MKHFTVIVVGAGFSGICIGIELKRRGIDDFVILEKADGVGGTWRENTYPGAECDIPSALYSFSFEHNDKWQFKWSGQAQILKYQQDTAAEYHLQQHLKFNCEIHSAEYIEVQRGWQLTTRDGRRYSAQHLVMAVGQLHHPAIPKFEGEDLFQGERFHSAQWDHQIDLAGKQVAVIGNAASAVQFIPEIAPLVDKLTIFQRSANWIVPKVDRPYSGFEQWVSRKFSWVTKIYRFSIWLFGEAVILPAIKGKRLARWLLRAWSLRALRRTISDPELIAKLTPDYPIGAKRLLFSDNYYPTLTRENVRLETGGIRCFTEAGLLLGDGVSEKFDVVIYATGFNSNPFLASMKIYGIERVEIHDAWSSGAHAYLGVATHGFPNLHMMYGPNTNLGHTSIIIMLEAQARYIAQSIVGLQQRSALALDVKADREQDYNEEIQKRLRQLAFNKVADSWYMDGGKITNNWAGGTREYRRRLSNVDWDAYTLLK